MINYVIGVALGGTSEMTALAVIERPNDQDDPPHLARHLERFAVSAPWSEVVAAVCGLVESLSDATVVVDYSGVGQPLIALLREAVDNRVVPVAITNGLAMNCAVGNYHVPKKELITFLQILLQNRRLHVARGLIEAPALADELHNFRLRAPKSIDALENWRTGRQDDLVYATVLACWSAERNPDPEATGIVVVDTVPPRFRHMRGETHERLRHRP